MRNSEKSWITGGDGLDIEPQFEDIGSDGRIEPIDCVVAPQGWPPII